MRYPCLLVLALGGLSCAPEHNCPDGDSALVFEFEATVDGRPLSLAVTDGPAGVDELGATLGHVDVTRDASGLVETIVAVGESEIITVDLRSISLGSATYEIGPGIGLSITSAQGGTAIAGTLEVDATGGTFNSLSFDVDVGAGRRAIGSLSLTSVFSEGPCA